MPIRKIPPGRRVPTGHFPSKLNGRLMDYESPLERDFFQYLEFEDGIEKYEEQPFEVEKRLGDKGPPLYPDCLVTYTPCTNKRLLLVEVKSVEDLKDPTKAKELRVKFSILREYARTRGMDFKVVTDKHIRGTYLDNLKFLYPYLLKEPKALKLYKTRILDIVKSSGPLSVTKVLDILAKNKTERAVILPPIWYLVSIKLLSTDLRKPLTNSSIIKVK